MAEEIEREIKYLVKDVPSNITDFPSKSLIDIYIPRKVGHAAIRVRKQGDNCKVFSRQ